MTRFSKKSIFKIGLIIFCIAIFVGFSNIALAQESVDNVRPVGSTGENTGLAQFLQHYLIVGMAWLAFAAIHLIGYLFSFLLAQLQTVAGYSQFTGLATVTTGWIIVRDLCNMFFILILLVIAFATILRVESYNAKRLLPKLLIMAVVINFSKMICGIIIDFSQIIMLTFINGLGSMNDLVDLLGIDHILNITTNGEQMSGFTSELNNTDSNRVADTLSVAVGLIAAVLVALLAVVIVGVLLVVLIFRIIMLWIYVILSPIAFITSTFPAGQKYAAQWWSGFMEEIISGPVIAFFLWLGISTARNSASNLESITPSDMQSGFLNAFFQGDIFQVYAITLALLWGGLVVAKQLGGVAGSVAAKGKSAFVAASGARWARERWGAFQGQRESLRKQKAATTGQRMFGLYQGAKSLPKTAYRGAKQTIGSAAHSTLMRFKSPEKRQEYIDDMKVKRQQRHDIANERVEAKQNMQNAHEYLKHNPDGQYEKDGYTYRKRMGRIIAEKDGRRVIGQGFNEFRASARQNMTAARQIIDKVNAEKINNVKAQYSGLSAADLKQVMQRGSSSKDQKAAASMMLAAKEAFSDRSELQEAKSNISHSPALLKDFNEAMDKRYAIWNNTAEGFKSKVNSGDVRVENQSTEQVKDNAEALDLIKDTVGSVKYADTMSAMSKTQDDFGNIYQASQMKMAELGDDFTKDDKAFRLFHAKHSGDMLEAAGGAKIFYKNDKAKDFVAEAIRGAKTDELAKLDARLFDKNKAREHNDGLPKEIKVNTDDLDRSIDEFKKVFSHNIKMSQLDNLRKSSTVADSKKDIFIQTAYESKRPEIVQGIKKQPMLQSHLTEAQKRDLKKENTGEENTDGGGI